MIVLVYLNVFAKDILSLSEAKVGECYKKVVIPAKYIDKDELIKVEEKSKTYIVNEAKFKKIKKEIDITPVFIDIQPSKAVFKSKKKNIVLNPKKKIFSFSKDSNIALDKKYLDYIKSEGINLDDLKEGECFFQYAKYKDINLKKEYISKQAYEIIDVVPAKFKKVKKKILVKPAYTKIIKTPAIYETKVIKILISPESKKYETINGKVCVKKIPPKYKIITKKILKKPPLTKVIKFPPTYKEIEVKELISKPIVTRRVIPPKKSTISYKDRIIKSYFWSKEKKLKDAYKTGLKVCKKSIEPKKAEVLVEVVDTPATVKKIKKDAKKIYIDIEKKIKDANFTTVVLPPQYQKIKTKVKIEDAKVVWRRVDCVK